jgi:hypothetical protein
MTKMSHTPIAARRLVRGALVILLALAVTDVTTLAQRSRGNVRSSSRSSVNRSTGANRSANVNRDTNASRNVNANRNVNTNRDVNRNIDVDRDFDVDRDIDVDVDGGCCYRGGWGAAAAVATTAAVTAAVVGSVVYSLPPSCTVVVVNGFSYQQCGSVWYQPQIAGSSTTYVVVDAP